MVREMTFAACRKWVVLLAAVAGSQPMALAKSLKKTVAQHPGVKKIQDAQDRVRSDHASCRPELAARMVELVAENPQTMEDEVKEGQSKKLIALIEGFNRARPDNALAALRSSFETFELNVDPEQLQSVMELLSVYPRLFVECDFYNTFRARASLISWGNQQDVATRKRIGELILRSLRPESEEGLSLLELILDISLLERLVEKNYFQNSSEVKKEVQKLKAQIRKESDAKKLPTAVTPNARARAGSEEEKRNLENSMEFLRKTLAVILGEIQVIPAYRRKLGEIVDRLKF